MSDFDNSDEDIASLLADDEDDIFSKKPFSTSPEKKTAKAISNISPKKSTNVAKHDILKQESLEKHSFKSSPVKHRVSKTSSKEISDTDDDDALNDLLSDSSMPSFLRGTKKSPAKKIETKSNEFPDDESKYLDELGFSKLSSDSVLKNQRNSLKSSIGDGDQSEDDDDILKSLGSDERGPTSPKRKASFFDDFLKSLSPKQSPKKSTPPAPKPLLEQIEKEEDPFDDDILGKVSSKSKTSHQSQKHSTPENKRGTLTKQVSFKDLPKTSPKHESPVKERKSSLRKESEPEIKPTNKPAAAPSKRSEKMGLSKSDDTDWLSFFKESPKKTNKSSESDSKLKSSLPEEISIASNEFKANANRRRSSSADWLGLSESHALSKDTEISQKSRTVKKDADVASEEFLQSTRPHTTGSIIATKPRRKVADDLSWLGEDSISEKAERKKEIPEPVYSDKNPVFLPEGKDFPEDNELKLESKKLSAQSSNVPFKRDIPTTKPFMKTAAPVLNTSEFDIQDTVKSSMESQFSRLPENAYDMTSKAVNLGEKSQIIGGSNDYALQAIINNHALEREQLMKTNEATKQMYEERIKSIESLHRDQLKSLEESLKSVEAKLKLEIDNTINSYEEKLSNLKQEKNSIEKDKKEKLELTEKQNLSEIQRLKDLHCQSIESMKRDHEDALSRLQRLKEQEIEAILSTQSHSRSLQQLADQLESRTAELASLQTKVEERNQTTWREKQLLLEAKERDLKNLQIRLQRQLDDGDEERTRLQQLVLRLEDRLQKNTTESEEDRWEVQQLKARLLVQQKHLDEEYKLQMEQVEKEKQKIRLSKDSILHEQKTVLQQLAQERQMFMQEKVEIDLLSKKLKEEETKFHVKKLKEESFVERQKAFLQQEESRLQLEKSNLKQEAHQLEREQDALLVEKQLLKEEKMRFNDLSFKIRRKESEVEALAMSTTEERERAQTERANADKIKSEHHFRIQQINQKMQALMEKEHQILEEKEKLSEEKIELDNQKSSVVCNKCKLSLGFPVNAPPPVMHNTPFNVMSAPTNHISFPLNNTPVSAFPAMNGVSNHVLSPHLDPSLVVWYITAKNDREYLQGELSFLKSLKDSKK